MCESQHHVAAITWTVGWFAFRPSFDPFRMKVIWIVEVWSGSAVRHTSSMSTRRWPVGYSLMGICVADKPVTVSQRGAANPAAQDDAVTMMEGTHLYNISKTTQDIQRYDAVLYLGKGSRQNLLRTRMPWDDPVDDRWAGICLAWVAPL